MMNFFDYPIRGVDLSTYDGAVNWDVLNTKIQFAIPRIGYGRTLDARFKANWAGCKVARQGYWYLDYYSNYNADSLSYGMTNAEWGRTQAQNAYNFVGESAMTWLDIESAGASYSPAISTVWARVQEIARAFLERMDELNGFTNGIYCSISLTKEFGAWFKTRPLWVAWYTRSKTVDQVKAQIVANGWTGRVWYWQYASDGDTDADGDGDGLDFGLGRKVMDLDVWMGTEDEWKAFTGEQQMADILLNITPLSQKDQRWGSVKLGTSSSTIGGYGCLITCASMMLRHFGIDTDPARLNDWLKANGGYYNGNLFVWNSLNKLDKRVSFGYRYQPVPLEKVDEQLRAGKPVIANVDMNPATPALDEHWVLIVGKDGDYLINDPWTGTRFKAKEKYPEFQIICTYNFEEVKVMYRVRVTIDNLLIRAGAGATYAIVERYAKGEYDVFEEQNGYGRIGKDRWIALAYTEKVGSAGVPTGEPSDAEKLRILWDWYKGSNNGDKDFYQER